jgi:hypothetical protein
MLVMRDTVSLSVDPSATVALQVTKSFCAREGIQMIVRGHEVASKGYVASPADVNCYTKHASNTSHRIILSLDTLHTDHAASAQVV